MYQDTPNCYIIANGRITWINAFLNAVNHRLLHIIPVQAHSLSSMAPEESKANPYDPSYDLPCSHFITYLHIIFMIFIRCLTLPTRLRMHTIHTGRQRKEAGHAIATSQRQSKEEQWYVRRFASHISNAVKVLFWNCWPILFSIAYTGSDVF